MAVSRQCLVAAAVVALTRCSAVEDDQVLVQVQLQPSEAGPSKSQAVGELWKRFKEKGEDSAVKKVSSHDDVSDRLLPAEWKKSESGATANLLHQATAPDFGFPECQCIGISGIEGTMDLTLTVDDKETAVSFPRDMGSRCEEWDKDNHPSCESGGEPWCYSRWCFVDACNCDIPVLPKLSMYMPNASYRGRHIYYSYTTCNNKDPFTEEGNPKACVNQKTEDDCTDSSKVGDNKCVWHDARCMGEEVKDLEGVCADPGEEAVVGQKECQCVGIAGREGASEVEIDGVIVPYAADMGSSCQAWDDGSHPDCGSSSKPDWCSKKWCYVDPCTCGISEPPKTSSFFPNATIQGRKIYYSYETCGNDDPWTADNHNTTCVQFTSEKDCSLDKCAWSEENSRCLGKELVLTCADSWGGDKPSKSAAVQYHAFGAALTVWLAAALSM